MTFERGERRVERGGGQPGGAAYPDVREQARLPDNEAIRRLSPRPRNHFGITRAPPLTCGAGLLGMGARGAAMLLDAPEIGNAPFALAPGHPRRGSPICMIRGPNTRSRSRPKVDRARRCAAICIRLIPAGRASDPEIPTRENRPCARARYQAGVPSVPADAVTPADFTTRMALTASPRWISGAGGCGGAGNCATVPFTNSCGAAMNNPPPNGDQAQPKGESHHIPKWKGSQPQA